MNYKVGDKVKIIKVASNGDKTYYGVPVGTVGVITYMRNDSVFYVAFCEGTKLWCNKSFVEKVGEQLLFSFMYE